MILYLILTSSMLNQELPDLLVWLSAQSSSLWFFSEVKAPEDYLGNTQKGWLHEHWDTMRGHYCLTILE